MERRRDHAPRTQVDLLATTVVKESTEQPDLEFTKAAALAAVGEGRSFLAPEPIGYDCRKGTVSYQRIDVGTPLGALVPVGAVPLPPATVDAFARAGAALGDIHAHLRVPGGIVRPFPETVARHLPARTLGQLRTEAEQRPVVGHGDYSMWNVFTVGVDAGPTTVVLDCCPNGYSSFEAVAHESRYVDLALFGSCLLGRSGLRDHVRLRVRNLAALRWAFLDGYESTSGVTIDRAHLRAVSTAVLAAYFTSRRGWSPRTSGLVAESIALRHRRN